MRKGEAKELAGMFTILAVLVAMGLGVSSVAPELSEIAEVRAPVEIPAVEAPSESEDQSAPVLLEPVEELPALLRIYEVVDSADPADPTPRLPVGLTVGV